MTVRDPFVARGRSNEAAYFHAKDAVLVEKLNRIFEARRDKDELRKVTGIQDDAKLDRFIQLSLKSELLTAFRLYPLVEIAWADGYFDKKEAQAVIDAATKLGVKQESAAAARLEEWLHNGPTEDARAAWKMLAGELRRTLSQAELSSFRQDLMRYANDVAEASGGVLNMFLRVSEKEQAVINKIAALLTHE